MSDAENYSFHMDVLHGPLEKIDVPRLVRECEETWWNQTLSRVNDCVVRLGILHGEFHWHKHDEEDEFFFVLEGRLLIDIEGRESVALGPKEGYLVPRGTVHRTRAPRKTVLLMVERASVDPSGD